MDRIALLSPCGWGNLGDAAAMDSAIAGIRRRRPGAEIIGITLRPEDTTLRHGIPAYTCLGFSLPNYGVREAPNGGGVPEVATADDPDGRDPGGPEPGGRDSNPWRRAYGLGRALATRAPGIGTLWSLVSKARAEGRHRARSFELMRGASFLVLTGGAQIDDFWGGALGHPYVIWRWGQSARAHGARFVMLSVGTGVLASAGSRWFARRALALADRRTFRDAGSRALLAELAPDTRGDPVVPDLAFGLPLPDVDRPAPVGRDPAREARRHDAARERRARPVVAIAPLVYCDPRVWPTKDAARYQRHISTLAELAKRLLRADRDIVLFATDGADQLAVADLAAAIAAQAGPEARGRVHVPAVDGVASLMRLLGDADVVVAGRLHAVLLSYVAGTPVVALSYERKVVTVVRDMGQAERCFAIEALRPPAAMALIERILKERESIAAGIRAAAAARRAAVERQYDEVFGPAQAGSILR